MNWMAPKRATTNMNAVDPFGMACVYFPTESGRRGSPEGVVEVEVAGTMVVGSSTQTTFLTIFGLRMAPTRSSFNLKLRIASFRSASVNDTY